MFRSGESSINFSGFELDPHEVKLLREGVEVGLTRKSIEILLYLIENRERVVSKDELFQSVWPDSYVDYTNLTQHIYRLRKTLDADTKHIETIPKSGYQFVGVISEDPKPSETPEESSIQHEQLKETTEIAEPKQESKRWIYRYSFIALLAVSILVVGIFDWVLGTNPKALEKPRVAVLPALMIGESDDPQLQLGVADTIISRLSKSELYRVVPTESVRDLDDTERNGTDIFKIGENLDSSFSNRRINPKE